MTANHAGRRPYNTCPRCGIKRMAVSSQRKGYLCADCLLVAADLRELETWR